MLNAEELKTLARPFPPDKVGVKIQSLNKNKDRALLVCYLQHTDVYGRLESVDPSWSCKTTHIERMNTTVSVGMQITLNGVARENVGEGEDDKSAYSDALKRTAMLFGVGRYLYDQENAWVPYNDAKDKFRTWTLNDFNQAIRNALDRLPRAPEPSTGGKPQPGAKNPPAGESDPKAPSPGTSPKAAPPVKPAQNTPVSQKNAPSRDKCNRILMNLYRPYLTQYPETRFAELLEARYQVIETRLLTLEQMEDLISYMEGRLAQIGDAERSVVETELLAMTKKRGKDMKWLDAQMRKNFKKPLIECSVEQMKKATAAMSKE